MMYEKLEVAIAARIREIVAKDAEDDADGLCVQEEPLARFISIMGNSSLPKSSKLKQKNTVSN